MARTVYYAAVSADGFIADARGGVGWLDRFNSPDLGYEAFVCRVGAVVLGRTTYDQTLAFGAWPYPGRLGLVVTSREARGLPDGVRAVAVSELGSALRAVRAAVDGDTWIVGGAKTARLCVDQNLVDEIEVYVVPQLLGDGIRLFDRSSTPVVLRSVETQSFANGVVRIRYAVGRAVTAEPMIL
jgi:dihydrofolate reductase